MEDNTNKLIKMLEENHALFKETFSNEHGRKVLEQLENKYYINKSTTANDENLDMFIRGLREGQRTVILYILNMLDDSNIKRAKDQIGDK